MTIIIQIGRLHKSLVTKDIGLKRLIAEVRVFSTATRAVVVLTIILSCAATYVLYCKAFPYKLYWNGLCPPYSNPKAVEMTICWMEYPFN